MQGSQTQLHTRADKVKKYGSIGNDTMFKERIMNFFTDNNKRHFVDNAGCMNSGDLCVLDPWYSKQNWLWQHNSKLSRTEKLKCIKSGLMSMFMLW